MLNRFYNPHHDKKEMIAILQTGHEAMRRSNYMLTSDVALDVNEHDFSMKKECLPQLEEYLEACESLLHDKFRNVFSRQESRYLMYTYAVTVTRHVVSLHHDKTEEMIRYLKKDPWLLANSRDMMISIARETLPGNLLECALEHERDFSAQCIEMGLTTDQVNTAADFLRCYKYDIMQPAPAAPVMA